MDPDELLEYALGRLRGPHRERLERRIASDPALAERVNRLMRNLDRLLDDGLEARPPAGSSPPTGPPASPCSDRQAKADDLDDPAPSVP